MTSTILIVEDDLDLREALQAILEVEGYHVTVAGDGIDGLQQMDMLMPGLILLDMMMPRMDGFGFVQALQDRGLHPKIPIILLTADGHAEQKATQVGAQGFVHKPFSVPDLLQQIAHLAPS